MSNIRLLISCLCFVAVTCQAKPTLDIQHFLTKNDVPVYFVETDNLPMLDVIVSFDAGSARDGEKYGLAQLTNALLDQGSHKLSANQIADNFDDVGAQFSSSVSTEVATLSLRSLSENDYLIPALATFQTVLSTPSFSTHAFDRERNAQLATIAHKQQRAGALAYDKLLQTLYADHPYGHARSGSAKTVQAITKPDVENFYQRYYVAKNMMIFMVGNINRDRAESIAERLSQAVSSGEKAQRLPTVNHQSPTHQHVTLPASQTTLLLGQVAIKNQDSDYFPLLVGNYTLGSGSFVSRLYQEVREKRGLSYGIYSQFSPMRELGPFTIYFATRAEQANQALAVTQDVLAKFLQTGPSEEEVTAAKKNITGSYPLKLDSNRAIASQLLMYGFYGYPRDYFETYRDKVNAVTQKEILNAFNRKVKTDTISVISVGNTKVATQQIKTSAKATSRQDDESLLA